MTFTKLTVSQKTALLAAAAILAACATSQENPNYQYSTKYKGDSPISSHGTSSQGTSYASTVTPGSVSDTRQVVFEQTPQSSGYAAANYATTTYAAPSYSRVDAQCVEQGTQNTVACPVMSVPITTQSASITAPYQGAPLQNQAETLYVTHETKTYSAPSPTEQAMPDSYGTPGYEAMKNVENGWSYETSETPAWETVDSMPTPSAQTDTAQIGVAVPMTKPFASPLPAPSVRQVRTPDMMPRHEHSITLGTSREIVEGDTVYSFARKLCSSVDEIRAMNSLDGTFNIRLGDTIRLPASKC